MKQDSKEVVNTNSQPTESVLNYDAAASNLLNLSTTPLVISSSSSASSSSSPPTFNQNKPSQLQNQQQQQQQQAPIEQPATTSSPLLIPSTPKPASSQPNRFVIKKVLDSELMSTNAATSTPTKSPQGDDQDAATKESQASATAAVEKQLNESELAANVSVVSGNLERKISKFTVKKVDTITILRTSSVDENNGNNAAASNAANNNTSIAEEGSNQSEGNFSASANIKPRDVVKKV
jgi:hypothetical protein